MIKNKLISDVNNPSEKDVQLIQSITQDPKKLEEAKGMYINDYSDYLGDQYTTREKAKAKQDRETQEKVASQGILALDPVVAQVEGETVAVYYTDVDGVSFDIKGNERVASVGINDGGDIKYVEVVVRIPDNYGGYSYETKKYMGDELTDEISQLVKNRIEVKAPKQINGWSRFTDKATKAIKNAPMTPNVESALNELSTPANTDVPQS